jgi:CDP-paratose 2-epimerase
MRVLVTGCCGFVGFELVRALRECSDLPGLEIIGIDNLSRRGSWRNLDRLRSLDVEVRHGDLRNASDLETIGSIDWVIDAAANPSVLAGVDGKASSRQLIEHNLLGTFNILELCKRCDAGLVLLSTSRVYSIAPLSALPVRVVDGAYEPEFSDLEVEGLSAAGINERFSTQTPISLYGATKLASEVLAQEYGQTFGFPVWINRCGVLAGAGQFGKADQGIFAFWLHSWREKRLLNYIGFDGHGHQVRDCLHPSDLAALVAKQLKTGLDPSKHSVINVSGGRASARSLRQLSSWCATRWGAHKVGRDSRCRPFDLPWVILDHSLASDAWSWRPTRSIENILNEIADFAATEKDWIQFST